MTALKPLVLPYLNTSKAGTIASVFTVALVISHLMRTKKCAEQLRKKGGQRNLPHYIFRAQLPCIFRATSRVGGQRLFSL